MEFRLYPCNIWVLVSDATFANSRHPIFLVFWVTGIVMVSSNGCTLHFCNILLVFNPSGLTSYAGFFTLLIVCHEIVYYSSAPNADCSTPVLPATYPHWIPSSYGVNSCHPFISLATWCLCLIKVWRHISIAYEYKTQVWWLYRDSYWGIMSRCNDVLPIPNQPPLCCTRMVYDELFCYDNRLCPETITLDFLTSWSISADMDFIELALAWYYLSCWALDCWLGKIGGFHLSFWSSFFLTNLVAGAFYFSSNLMVMTRLFLLFMSLNRSHLLFFLPGSWPLSCMVNEIYIS